MKHTQWFYFMASNTRAGPTYKFTIINLLKSGSLYNEGMKPLFYSDRNAKNKNIGWVRTGHNIHYYKNNIRFLNFFIFLAIIKLIKYDY